MCPTLQEDGLEQANALSYHGPSAYQGQGSSRPKYDPYLSTFNSGLLNHLNLSYGTQHQNVPPPTLLQHNRPPGFQQPRNFASTHTNNLPLTHPSSSTQNPSLEDLVKAMATSSMQFQ